MPRRRFSSSLARRADQAGILVAGMNVPLTFQRTLMPRNTMDQAIVTGLSIAANHALVSLVQESIQSGALLVLGGGKRKGRNFDDRTWSQATIALDLVAVGAGIAIQRGLRQRHREPLPRATARTGGFVLAASGGAGAIIGVLQEAFAFSRGKARGTVPMVVPAASALAVVGEYRRRRAEHLDTGLPPEGVAASPAKALALGVLVTGAVSSMGLGERVLADAVATGTGRVLRVNPELLRPLGHAAAMLALTGATRVLVEKMYGSIEKREESVEAAFDVPPPNPFVSGSLDSHVDFSTLARQGRRFAWTVTSVDKIEEVMGEAATASPIRVYVGLESAEDEDARVALVLDELDRTGAFDRSWLLVDSPTGTGYVNYAAVNALELLSRGDCATVAMQYAAKPSVLSLGQVNEGRRQARLLLNALHARLTTMPADRRPKLVLFGESLGAWTSQDPFVDRGTQGLVDTGIDHSIWIGTPHFSKWKEQVLFDDRPDVDAGLVGVFSEIEEWKALEPAEREKLRYVMITHHDDGVAVFGPELAIQAPEWLGPPETRPTHVPRAMRWVPTTTFFQVLVDMKNSANVVPGKFAAKGHDYRGDLLPFFHATLGFAATEEQLDRIGTWLELEELQRSEWIKAHGAAGKSLASAIIEATIVEARELGEDANAVLARLVHAVAEDQFGAGGGASVPKPPPAPNQAGPNSI
ncbi:MAG: alpha/beta-hydrolase family protein [Acidimicrobiia bacterium]